MVIIRNLLRRRVVLVRLRCVQYFLVGATSAPVPYPATSTRANETGHVQDSTQPRSCRRRHQGGRHRRTAAPGSVAQDRSPAERDSHQCQFLDHRHRRKRHHSTVQCRRGADAGVPRRRSREQDQPQRHPRSAGSDGARACTEPRTRNNDHPGLRGTGVRGHPRGIEDSYELTYICKDGSRFPAIVSITALRDDYGDVIGYLLDRHRQFRAQAGRAGAAKRNGRRGKGQSREIRFPFQHEPRAANAAQRHPRLCPADGIRLSAADGHSEAQHRSDSQGGMVSAGPDQ